MGKKDGFLLYPRVNVGSGAPLERIKGFGEFKRPLTDAQRREQAARCMNCGVPFCQSGVKLGGMYTGCPLHNLIPEWNDMLSRENPEHALSRLLKVNCFPEFTGRICPAFCQRACVLGEQGEPVQIKANELFIIEFAFEKGFMLPQPPQARSGKTAAIIGGGPAGMAAAWHLNRRGHLVTVYDQGTEPGGQLLQIPNNQLPPEIVRRRVRLMEEEGVVFKCGVTANREELAAQYDTVVSCTGPRSKKESLVVLAIAEGKEKAAQADIELMGFTSIEI